MRSLTATALGLAFLAMVMVTYLALKGDPMGGEPRLLVKIALPDLDRLQPPAKPAPQASTAPPAAAAPAQTLAAAPPRATAAASSASPAATASTSQPPAPSPAVTAKPAADPAPDFEPAGIGITLPQ